jgi:RNA polymerase sigma-70 factor (ECF subfamily)
MTMKNEATILSAKEGSESAFRRLYDSHRERIYRIAYRYARSVHDAEDIMQETFIRAFRRIGAFRIQGDSSFESWLTSICINCAIDHMRKRQRRKMDTTITIDDTIIGPEANDESPETAAEREEILLLIRSAAEKLTPKQKIAFDLRYNDHLSIKEISQLMNCSENAVKTHISRSARKLKAWLAPLWRN